MTHIVRQYDFRWMKLTRIYYIEMEIYNRLFFFKLFFRTYYYYYFHGILLSVVVVFNTHTLCGYCV